MQELDRKATMLADLKAVQALSASERFKAFLALRRADIMERAMRKSRCVCTLGDCDSYCLACRSSSKPCPANSGHDSST